MDRNYLDYAATTPMVSARTGRDDPIFYGEFW
jgi:hypothetical protein